MKVLNYKNLGGFTLAEVIITLGIIGVIAAMTIPSLIENVNNVKNTAILKQDIAILKQTFLRANDAGAFASIAKGNDIAEMKYWFEDYFQAYLRPTQVCYDEDGCWGKNVKRANGAIYAAYGGSCGVKSVSFILPNGSFVCYDDYSGGYKLDRTFGIYPENAYYMAVLIDVNGANLPNIIGKDIFIFIYRSATNELIPAGFDMTESEIEQNCRLSSSGFFCTAKAARQNFKLPVLK